MTGRKIALASCHNLPDWEVDDRPFHAALAARGADFAVVPWDAEVDWAQFDACLIRTTWDYSERLPEFLAWTKRVASLTKLFNGPQLVAWNTHKSYLADLEARGVATIPTEWLAAGADGAMVAAAVAKRGWTRAFLKPVVGACARLTLPFAAEPEGLHAAAELLAANPTEAFLLQPYLDRVERDGEFSAIFVDGAFTHGVRKVPVAGDYRVQDDFGAHDEPWSPTAAERDLARAIVANLPFPWLYARVDLLRDESGALLLTELEAVEPSLFFRHGPAAAECLAAALIAACGSRSS